MSNEYAKGFRDARAACHTIALNWIDGDSQCDGTITRIADDIERLPGPTLAMPDDAERMTGLCTDKSSCSIALELRRALSETPKWVPVTERLPAEGVMVICTGWNYQDEAKGRWTVFGRTSKRIDTGWECVCVSDDPESDGWDRLFPPTHWMPLPEAPK